MAKVKLTKGELKKQRDSLKQYRHYLPTLLLKKQQLQMKILEARNLLSDRELVLRRKVEEIEPWAGLLADSSIDITPKIIELYNQATAKPAASATPAPAAAPAARPAAAPAAALGARRGAGGALRLAQ